MPRRSSRFLAAAAALCVVFAVGTPAADAAAPPASIAAAREALVLTNSRLGLMDEVMASKWFSRTPIQDPAQETAVIEAAVAKASGLGVAPAGTRALFEAEIGAAKEVELGWGSEWLFYGAPPGLAAPELSSLRAQLGGISELIVATLPRLAPLTETPGVRLRLLRASSRILTVPFLDRERREAIVDALLAVRSAAA